MLQPADRTMLYWMALTAQNVRGDESLESVASLAEVSVGSLRAFERANSWPQAARLDRVLAAYASVGGLGDAREIWRRALAQWEVDGEPPHLDSDRLGANHHGLPGSGPVSAEPAPARS